MKLGSLFSGGGLGDFGFMAAGMEIAWQCEIDEYCQKILALRYPESKKYRDIKILKGAELEPVDIITGGFPCQPFSVAGLQMGERDDRNLWPQMCRIISEVNPTWVIGENVVGLLPIYLDTIYSDLEAIGYEVMPVVFSAHALGARHRRERVWFICHAKHNGWTTTKEQGSVDQRNDNYSQGAKETGKSSGSSKQYETMGNTKCGIDETFLSRQEQSVLREASERWSTNGFSTRSFPFRRFWSTEPAVGRVANGIADRVHRLKMLGNGQVPACTYVIGKMIMEIELNAVLDGKEENASKK